MGWDGMGWDGMGWGCVVLFHPEFAECNSFKRQEETENNASPVYDAAQIRSRQVLVPLHVAEVFPEMRMGFVNSAHKTPFSLE
jgi:hypothetical protein